MSGFTRIQGTGVSSSSLGTSQSVTFGLSVTAGNLILVNATVFSATHGGGTTTINDSQTNSYITDVDFTDGGSSTNYDSNIFRTIAGSSGSLTITISTTRSRLISFSIEEYSFTGGTITLDSVGGNYNVLTSNPSTTPLTVSSNDLIIAGFGLITPSLTYTAGGSFTLGYTNNTIGTLSFVSEYWLSSSGSPITPSVTLSGNSEWNGVAAAYSIVAPLVNVYSSDSSFEKDTDFPLVYILNSDISLSVDKFIFSSFIYLVDYSTGTEATNLVGILSDVWNADASSTIDQQTVKNIFINQDSSSSLESFNLNSIIYKTDFMVVSDQGNDFAHTSPSLRIIRASDIAIAIESQSTHNVIQNYDSDSAFASESQFVIGQFFYSTESPSATESQFPEIFAGDFSLAIDKQVFASAIFYSSDSAITSEAQQIMITGGSSATVFDHDPTAGVEAWLRIFRIGDLAIGRENQSIKTTIITSGIAEASIGLESQLPIRFSYESPSVQDTQFKFITFFSTDSATAQEKFIYSKLIIQTDFARTLETSILSKSLIAIGTGIIDSATGNETQLPIRLYSDSGTGLEYQAKNILGSSFGSITDNGIGVESSLRIIFNIERPIATDKQFLSYSTMSSSSAGVDSAIGRETQLRITTSGESPVSLDQQLRTLFDINTSFAIDRQTVLNFSVNAGAAETESSHASEAFLRIMLAGDFGSVVNTGDTSSGMIPVAPPSTTSITDVLNALLIYLNSTGVVGPSSIDYVIDPDSVTLWPTNPGPLLLIQPLELRDAGDTIGAGRYGKTWTWEITIHVIVDNIYDSSFKDIFINESHNYQTGPFQLAYQVQILLEQAYLINSFYQPVLIEFPYFLSTEKIKRYKGANSYAGIPIRFMVVFRDNLPSLNIP